MKFKCIKNSVFRPKFELRCILFDLFSDSFSRLDIDQKRDTFLCVQISVLFKQPLKFLELHIHP